MATDSQQVHGIRLYFIIVFFVSSVVLLLHLHGIYVRIFRMYHLESICHFNKINKSLLLNSSLTNANSSGMQTVQPPKTKQRSKSRGNIKVLELQGNGKWKYFKHWSSSHLPYMFSVKSKTFLIFF